MAGSKCSQCNSVIIGPVYNYQGKKYCSECYKKIMDKVERENSARADLIEFIKSIFGLVILPDSWYQQIDGFKKSGKSYNGMKYTLYYFYLILGHTPNKEYGLFVINQYYKEATLYYQQQKDICDKNAKANIKDIPPRVVNISTPENKKRKEMINMEEL